jgi:hypothetical protein
MEDIKLVKKITDWNPIRVEPKDYQRIDGEIK